MPKLKKNLISLGSLKSKFLVVMIRDGVLKATSGALVILKGVRKENLYYYQGSTVLGTLAAATSSTKKDIEVTKLCIYGSDMLVKIPCKSCQARIVERYEDLQT